MNILLDLKRFITTKNRPEDAAEVLQYVTSNADAIAPEFHVDPIAFMVALILPEPDEQIVRRLLTTVKSFERRRREKKAAGKVSSAQESANQLGADAIWENERAHLDMSTLFASLVTKSKALLVFAEQGFEVAVYMQALLGLTKLKKQDLTGWVDAKGLHVRWNGGKGGLDLKPQIDRDAERITVTLSPRTVAIAA
jgi:hypothetical protein